MPAAAEGVLRKHVWIELIAFDVEAPDLGVAAVIDGMGEQPELLSLLLYSAEFLHEHDDRSDALLPRECTSYFAREWSVRGPRQDWTRADLRRLVQLLRERGTDTAFAVFDLFTYNAGGGEVSRSAWAQQHPELHVVDDDGKPCDGLLNPLKRLADGRLYQEYVAERVAAVIAYYGFAAFHGADGFSSGRLPLWRADFSDDMRAQFTERTGIRPEATGSRELAVEIWRTHRRAWIRFHAERWNELWTEICAAVHGQGAFVMLNNAWTRDPVEALYRYGVDYRGLVTAGVDRFVLETVVAAVELLEEPPALPPLPGQLATVLMLSAAVPTTPLSALISVRDTHEAWDVIRSAPTMHERDVRELTSMRRHSTGGATPCLDAGLYCLSDGLDRRDWDWMDAVRGSSGAMLAPGGSAVTLVYDPAVIDAEVDALIDGRIAHTQAVVAALIRSGMDVSGVVAPQDAASVPGALLLIHPQRLADDLVAALALRSEPVLTLGLDEEGGGSTWRLAVQREGLIELSLAAEASMPVDEGRERYDSWAYELDMLLPPGELIEAAVAAVAPAQNLPRGVTLRERGELDAGWVLTMRNASPWFRRVTYEALIPVRSAEVLPGTNTTPPAVRGSSFTTRVPPHGVVAVRVTGTVGDCDGE